MTRFEIFMRRSARLAAIAEEFEGVRDPDFLHELAQARAAQAEAWAMFDRLQQLRQALDAIRDDDRPLS